MAAAAVAMLATSVATIEHQRRLAVAEKARAERHFASVRKLANAFIFDVHGKIENLAGSLEAREMLVKTSLEYLDSLSGEAGSDPALLFELAAAYRKIGNIQGEAGAANTGNLAAAIGNYEKAKGLFVTLERLKPDDIATIREHRKLSYALARGYFVLANPRWEPEIAEALRLAERMAVLPGATTSDRAQLASTLVEKAHLVSLMTGRSPDVEATMARAIALLEALVREAPRQVDLREALAGAYSRAGKIQADTGRTAQSAREASKNFRKALAIVRELRAEFPDDARKLSIELDNISVLAAVLILAGDYREADRTIGEALGISRGLVVKDPKNVSHVADLMTHLNVATQAAWNLGDNPRAIRLGREVLAHGARLPAQARSSRHVRYALVEAKVYIGYALLAEARKGSFDRGDRLARLREARSLFSDGFAFLAEVRAENMGTVPDDEVKRLEDAVKQCDEAIARLDAP